VGDADGSVSVAQVIAAIDWVVQHRRADGLDIRVLNLSYGAVAAQPYQVDPLAYAVEQAWRAGIVVVAAAGNSGYQRGAWAQGLADPAYDPEIVSVGAADTMGTATFRDDEVAPFSATAASCSSGCRAPDLVAPGAHLQGLRVPGSYLDEHDPGSALGERYFRGSGTSEAAAFVSGAVADLLQRYPGLTPDQVKAMLTSSCVRLLAVNWKQEGCGELDLARLFAAPVPSPAAAAQASAPSTGTGPVDESRDASSWPGSSWSGSSWSGSSWSGDGWSGSSWSGSSWSGSSWSGASWLDADWG
ncbi:MAG TPA: S8 family serine peptidase, partial [Gaiellaceae bacterium]|nr:S8 family serine peptidase [Gaiellaceae bacterium]